MNPFRWLGDAWAAQQRAMDVRILWPICCEQADDEEHARMVFFVHAKMDPAWTRLGDHGVIRAVSALPYSKTEGTQE